MTSKRYTTRISDEEIQNWLDKQANVAEFLKELIVNYIRGDLLDAKSLELEFKKLRNQKYKSQILEIDMRNKITLIHRLKFSPERAQRIADGKEKLVTVSTDGSTEEPTFIPPEELNIGKYLDFLKRDDEVWSLQCKFCGIFLNDPVRDDILRSYKEHLYDKHLKELVQ